MKRFFALFLILIIMTSSAYANKSTQLKWGKRFITLTDEELSDANAALQKIIFTRKASVDGVPVTAGIYMVGEDIPEGVYRIDYKQETEHDFCSFLAVNEGTDFSFTSIIGFGGSSGIGKIELTKGTQVKIFGGSLYFYTYTGLIH